ncbi:hypothetical protein BLA24_07735 [Streptomyces cinnamoneus]|uniref:Uncharacterized protein n=1 Tax=Streptomyces cinnamoneus TaxID=53446 RepID=A0A2G1XMH2_STRCJ|nr:hypothetical protein BLA24_07735 [Streptomyces cinnamoneus]PPT11542.1 hypothetical protein CYQ11_00165 [Streptomyces cinnamoneus]
MIVRISVDHVHDFDHKVQAQSVREKLEAFTCSSARANPGPNEADFHGVADEAGNRRIGATLPRRDGPASLGKSLFEHLAFETRPL